MEKEITQQQDTPQTETAEENTQTANTNLGEGVEDVNGEEQAPQTEDEQEGKEDKQEIEENKDLFGKPETYDYKDVQLPDGMTLNKDMTDKFNAYAAKLNLSNKGANDLMTMAVDLVKNERENAINSFNQLQAQKIENYKYLLNTDKEIGGSKLKESIKTANIAYDAFFKDEELREILADGGLNVHPKFIKALKQIGANMNEDKIYSSPSPADEKLSREDILYPSMA